MTDLPIDGPFIADLEMQSDERGGFARTWCAREFRERGVSDTMVQSSISVNHLSGTLRGMHFQGPPSREGKLVRCTHGEILDVIVDLRPDSPTFLQNLAIELSSSNQRSLYVPPAFAHGFLTLAPDTTVLYMMNDYFQPETSGGLRWDDPALAIDWPIAAPRSISQKDLEWPDIDPDQFDTFRGY